MNREKGNLHWALIGMVALLLLTTALVWHDLAVHEVLGRDENLTIIKVHQPDLKALLAASRVKASGDPTAMPPLYFFAQYFFWPLVQRNTFMLRFLSSVAAILTVVFTYKLASVLLASGRFASTARTVGLVAGLLTILLTITVRYAQIARPYTFLTLFSMASAYFVIQAQKSNRPAHWAGFVCASTLNIYNHYVGLFVLAAEGLFIGVFWLIDLFAVLRRQRSPRILIGPVLGFLMVGLLSLPSLMRLIQIPEVGTRGQPQVELTVAFFHRLLYKLGLVTPWLRGLVLGLMAVGLLAAARLRQWKVILLSALWMAVPLLALSVLRTPRPFAERYLIFLPPVAFLLVGMGVVALGILLSQMAPSRRRPAVQWAVDGLLSAILVLSLVPSLRSYYQANRAVDRLDLTLQIVETSAQPGDLILVSSRFFVRPLKANGAQTLYLADDLTPAEFQTLLADYQRIWVLYTSYLPSQELQEPMDQWIQTRFDHFVRVPIKAITALALYHNPQIAAEARWKNAIPILEQLAEVSVGNQEAWLRYDALAAAHDSLSRVYAQRGDSIRAKEHRDQAKEIRATAPKP